MAWPARGTALPGVTTAGHVADLTGQGDLSRLESSGQLTMADLLVTASDAIRDQLVSDGVDPSLLTNEEAYQRCVAFHFLAMLVLRNLLPMPEGLEPPRNPEGQADPYAWSDVYYLRVRPLLSSGDQPRRSGEAIPRVANLHRKPLLGRSSFWDDTLRRR